MAPAPTCNHLKCQQAAAKAEHAHTQLIFSAVSIACNSSTDGSRAPPLQVTKILLANMDKIRDFVKKGKISSAQIKQLKQFAVIHCRKPDVAVTDNTPRVLSTEARKALAKKWATSNATNVTYGPAPSPQILKDVLEAYQAHTRIENLLQNYTGPELTCVRSLFPLLKNLPLGSNSIILTNPARPPIPANMVPQDTIRHSIVWGSNDTLLYRGDLCRLILAHASYYNQLAMQNELTTEERDLLTQLFQSFQRERNAVLSKMVLNVRAEVEIYRRMGLQMDSKYTFEVDSLPMMRVMEAYHAVSLLNQFFNGYHSGQEYAGTRALLFKCRRELQTVMNSIFKRTNFLTYIS